MNIFQLKVFLDLFREKKFSQVAKMNYRTQPAITSQIKLLEEELGIQLFERTKQKVEPTQAARDIEPFVHNILESCEEIEHYAKNTTGKPTGSLRIATVHSVGIYGLSPYLKDFIHSYPLIHLHLEYRNSDVIYEMVAQKLVDFGIVAYPKESRQISFNTLKKDRLVIIVCPSHPFAKKKELLPEDLKNQKFVAFSDNLPTRRAVDDFLLHQGVFVKICMMNDNIDTLKNAVEIGVGISMVPEGTVLNEVKSGTLCAIPLKNIEIERPIGILFRREKLFSPSAKLFLNLVLKKP